MDARERTWLMPLGSLLIALALSLVPLPAAVASFRPDWVAIIMLYWAFTSPPRFGLLTAFWMGLALDTLSGALLGQHALALVAVVYLSHRFYLRIRVFPISQMCLTVLALLALYEFILFWIDGVAGRTVPMIERWAPVLGGVIVWPLVQVYFDRVRRDTEARI